MLVLCQRGMVHPAIIVYPGYGSFIIVHFNGMLQVVDIDQLYVKLVLVLFHITELFTLGNVRGHLTQLVFKAGEFFPVFTHLRAPGTAFFCKMAKWCCGGNHWRRF